jgi:cytochrome c5
MSQNLRRLLPMLGVMLFTGAQADEPNRVYDTNCALCHQRAGVGLTGQFPRLAGRAAEIATSQEGRRYLVEVALFGMAGKVEVDGVPIIGVMPSFATLTDEDLASALNYIIALEGPTKSKRKGKLPTIGAGDVKDVRGAAQLSPGQVRANREAALAANQK